MTQGSSSKEFEGIQYLRAVAALMVVAHHAANFFGDVSNWTTFGSRGVDIFFVISGFIMVHATRAFDPKQPHHRQAIDFLVRRAIRVVPLYWLALLYLGKRPLWEGTANYGLLSDFLFIPRFNSRTPEEIWPSLIPGWTINYEMQFYVLFGIALLFGSRRFWVLIGGISGLVLLGGWVQFQSAPAIFWTSSVLGEFVLGMGVYWTLSRFRNVHLAVAVLAGIAGLSILAVENGNMPRLLADGPFAAMVVWSGVHLAKGSLHQKWLLRIGDASYSIYLTHVFTFVISDRLCEALGLQMPTAPNIVLVLAIKVVLATLIGLLVHYLIERPLLRFMLDKWRKLGSQKLTPASTRPTEP